MSQPQTALIIPLTFPGDVEQEERRRNVSSSPCDSDSMQGSLLKCQIPNSFNDTVLRRNPTALVVCLNKTNTQTCVSGVKETKRLTLTNCQCWLLHESHRSLTLWTQIQKQHVIRSNTTDPFKMNHISLSWTLCAVLVGNPDFVNSHKCFLYIMGSIIF